MPCLMTPGKPTETRSNAANSRMKLVEHPQHGARRGDGGRDHALPLAERLAARIEQHGFDAGAANVDGRA